MINDCMHNVKNALAYKRHITKEHPSFLKNKKHRGNDTANTIVIDQASTSSVGNEDTGGDGGDVNDDDAADDNTVNTPN